MCLPPGTTGSASRSRDAHDGSGLASLPRNRRTRDFMAPRYPPIGGP
jgi:hypothetical protein